MRVGATMAIGEWLAESDMWAQDERESRAQR
jgi:hypothetical protein